MNKFGFLLMFQYEISRFVTYEFFFFSMKFKHFESEDFKHVGFTTKLWAMWPNPPSKPTTEFSISRF